MAQKSKTVKLDPLQTTVRVEGLRSLIRATDAAGKETKKLVRDTLREAAVPVRDDAVRLLARIDARSATGLGISVRRTGVVSVEQRKRRTTGKRGDFGVLQMRRSLLPALAENRDEVVESFEEALERWAHEWEVRAAWPS